MLQEDRFKDLKKIEVYIDEDGELIDQLGRVYKMHSSDTLKKMRKGESVPFFAYEKSAEMIRQSVARMSSLTGRKYSASIHSRNVRSRVSSKAHAHLSAVKAGIDFSASYTTVSRLT